MVKAVALSLVPDGASYPWKTLPVPGGLVPGAVRSSPLAGLGCLDTFRWPREPWQAGLTVPGKGG